MDTRLLTSPANWRRLVAAAALAFCAAAPAQLPAPQPRLMAGPTYTSSDGSAFPQFPRIDVVFAAQRADGTPYQVNAAELTLISEGMEAGTASSIRPFAATGYGVTTVLALDTSSLNDAPDAIETALTLFLSKARPQDRFAVATLGDAMQAPAPFGTRVAPSLPSLSRPAATAHAGDHAGNHAAAHLYDSLFDALSLFTNAQPRRRQLLLLSNGQDLNSRHTPIDVLLKAKSMGVEIDCLIPASAKAAAPAGLEVLEQFAAETGGFMLPFSDPSAAGGMDTAIQQALTATQATPVATFQLSHVPADGAVHSLQLRWQRGNLAAPAFLKTPQNGGLAASLPDSLSGYLTNFGPWALGLCFLAGLLLLGLSLRKPAPPAAQPAVLPGTRPGTRPAVPEPLRPPSPAPQAVQQRAPVASLPVAGTPVAGSGGSARIITGQRRQSVARSFTIADYDPAAPPPAPELFPANPQGPFAQLQMIQGELTGRSLPMTVPTFSVGAAASNHLVLQSDPTLSGKHIHLLWQASTLKIEDRNSTNGTFLNTKRLPPGQHSLKPGDQVRIGRVVFVVQPA